MRDVELDKELAAYTSWKDKHGGFANYMTLRDYFAAHASEEDIKHAMRFVQPVEATISGFNGHKEIVHQHPTNARQVARYIVADQMLEARK